MFYAVYKITNELNNRIYIGIHKTSNLDDSYMGSGKILKKAQEKYGIENFKKEILEVFNNPEDMYNMESKLVNGEFIKRDDTYNLKEGGIGGFDYINELKLWDTEKKRDSAKKNLLKANLKNIEIGYDKFRGKTHSDSSREKMSKSRVGKKTGSENSSFGKKWIHNDEGTNLLIDNNLIDNYISEGWILGMKQNQTKRIAENNPMFGKIWITNEFDNKVIPTEDLLQYTSVGWRKGRTIKKF